MWQFGLELHGRGPDSHHVNFCIPNISEQIMSFITQANKTQINGKSRSCLLLVGSCCLTKNVMSEEVSWYIQKSNCKRTNFHRNDKVNEKANADIWKAFYKQTRDTRTLISPAVTFIRNGQRLTEGRQPTGIFDPLRSSIRRPLIDQQIPEPFRFKLEFFFSSSQLTASLPEPNCGTAHGRLTVAGGRVGRRREGALARPQPGTRVSRPTDHADVAPRCKKYRRALTRANHLNSNCCRQPIG
jgi:hypothetical protein